MAVKPILLLGEEALYRVSDAVTAAELEGLRPVVQDLHDTMMAFRAQYGCGRAIAAPQIGVFKRLIYLHIDKPTVFVNPVLTGLSDELMTLWDDCMCFPELLVRVRRHRSCTISFLDIEGRRQEWYLEGDLSELLQHEYDHLDGILATQRALDDRSIVLKRASRRN
jgi:peptide deformylase